MKKIIVTFLLGLGLSSQTLVANDLDQKGTHDPFVEMKKMQDEIDKIFERMRSNMLDEEFFSTFTTPKSGNILVDLKELKDRYQLKADIPGADNNKINISTKNGVLKIEAKTQKDEKKKEKNFLKEERFIGTFVRELTLPKDADVDKMQSHYKEGVLEIEIPKKH